VLRDRPKQELGAIPSYTAITAVPARYALERGDWAGAAALTIAATGRPQADALIRFARGLGLARGGDAAGAKREIQALQDLRAALEKSGQGYWAERTDEQMLAVSAWVASAEGAPARALELMRAAADGEDASVKHVAMENRLYPMRELLADLLLQQGRPAEALREYETSLKETPNRFRGLYGAARSAEAAGDRQKATDHFEKLLALGKQSDTARPELDRARAFLGRR
jgi:tetratricopeptide (TPR) repeat protein